MIQTSRRKKKTTTKPTSRRTQAERRDATRARLIESTLRCLEIHGYAETSVSLIIAQAKVSRGALVHHYASKNDLILDAAQSLMIRVFQRLETLILETGGHANRIDKIIERIWQEFFASSIHTIYIELSVASRRDEKLAKVLRSLVPTLENSIGTVFDRHFQPSPNAVASGDDMFVLTRWLLRGMAIDAHLLADPKFLKRHLQLWSKIIATQIVGREE